MLVSEFCMKFVCLTFFKESICLNISQGIYLSQLFLTILLPQFLYQIRLSHYFQWNLFVSGYFTESHCLKIVCIISLSHYLLRNLFVSIFPRRYICPRFLLPNLFVSVFLRKSKCLNYFQHDPTISKGICLSQYFLNNTFVSPYLLASVCLNIFLRIFFRSGLFWWLSNNWFK